MWVKGRLRGDAAGRSEGPGLPGDLVMMAGCPVLIVPYVGTFETGGANVLVAWNASREAARAVHDALPILQRANKVTVVTIEPGAAGRIPGADICTYLSRHGVIPGELAIGDTILTTDTLSCARVRPRRRDAPSVGDHDAARFDVALGLAAD